MRKEHFFFFIFMAFSYAAWLWVHWPGVLGNDSAAVFMEINDSSAQFFSGKTAIWVWFVKLGLWLTPHVGWLVGIQLLLIATVFTRILAWCWGRGHFKTAVFGVLLIAAAPHMVMFGGTLYPDALFAVAGLGVAFELWRCMRERHVSAYSLFIMATALPFALFARSNGLVWWLPLAYAIWLLRGRGGAKLLVLSGVWGLAAFGAAAFQAGTSQGAMFPLVLFETVNFLQPHPFEEALEAPVQRTSEETAKTLARYASADELLGAYDRDYWDTLVHTPNSPYLLRMTQADQHVLIREFWRYNVWRNVPAFLSSRVNVFLLPHWRKAIFRQKVKQPTPCSRSTYHMPKLQ